MSIRSALISFALSVLILPTIVSAAENGINVSGNIVLEKDGNGNPTGVVFTNGDVLTTAPKDGKSLLSGAGAPTGIVGNPGDFYIDTVNSILYGPYSGGWGVGVSLVGPKGAKGDTGGQGIQGIQGPAGSSPFTLNGTSAVYTNGSVGIGVNPPSTAAALDVSSTSKGFLPPRMTTAQRTGIVSPSAGLMIYNTSTNQLNFYNGSAWEAVSTAQPELLGQITGAESFNTNFFYFTGYMATHTGTISSVNIRVNSTGNFQLLIKNASRVTQRSSSVVPVSSTGLVTDSFPAVTINAGEFIGFNYTGTTTGLTAAGSTTFFGSTDPPSQSNNNFQMSILAILNY